MTASMRVSFEATLDDFVDVNVRSMKRSGLWNRLQVITAITDGLLGAVLTFGSFLFTSLPVEFRLGLALTVGLAFAFFSLVFLTRIIERRLRTYFQPRFGTRRTLVVEVELDAQGISFTQLGTRQLYEWSTVQGIESGSDRIDFLFSSKGLATVRTRAFESPMQQKEFVDLANQYMKANRPTASLSNAPSR